MKDLLDKFERSSLVLKFLILMLALLILATGWIFAMHGNRESATRPVRSSMSSSTTSSTDDSSDKEGAAREVDEAIKDLEANPSKEKLEQVRALLSKIEDEASRTAFESRLQAVEASLNTASTSAAQETAPASSAPTSQQSPEAPATPASSEQLYVDANGQTYTADQVYTDPATGETFVR